LRPPTPWAGCHFRRCQRCHTAFHLADLRAVQELQYTIVTMTVTRLEQRYGCRYERAVDANKYTGPFHDPLFPVTHSIHGTGHARWACVDTGDPYRVAWGVVDNNGKLIACGGVSNVLLTAAGHVKAIREALAEVGKFGVTQRVFPRDRNNCKRP